jgi:hypothetical protein
MNIKRAAFTPHRVLLVGRGLAGTGMIEPARAVGVGTNSWAASPERRSRWRPPREQIPRARSALGNICLVAARRSWPTASSLEDDGR